MQEKTTIHYCAGHRKKIKAEDWRWASRGVGKKKVWICPECIYCAGCRVVHPTAIYGGYQTKTDPNTGKWVRICFKHVNPTPPSTEKRMEGMSPEEVLSGVQYGGERLPYLGKDTENFTPTHKEQVKKLKDALK